MAICFHKKAAYNDFHVLIFYIDFGVVCWSLGAHIKGTTLEKKSGFGILTIQESIDNFLQNIYDDLNSKCDTLSDSCS